MPEVQVRSPYNGTDSVPMESPGTRFFRERERKRGEGRGEEGDKICKMRARESRVCVGT